LCKRPNAADKVQQKSLHMYFPLQIYDLLGVSCLMKVVWRSKLAESGEQFVTILLTTETQQSLVPSSASGMCYYYTDICHASAGSIIYVYTFIHHMC